MKIQFAFLSLFLATAHAGHEPKGLRGRAGDDQDVDLLGLGYTAVPNGSSATIKCGEGSQCCATGQFYGGINYGYSSTTGSGGCAGTTYNNANAGTCQSSSCSISCDGTCNVVVKAGSGGGGGGYGGYQPDGTYNHHKSNSVMPGYSGGGVGGMPGVPGSVPGMPSNNRGNTLGPYYNGGGVNGNGSPYYTPGYPGGNRGGMSGPYYMPGSGGSPQYQPGYDYGSPSYPGTAGIHRKSGYSGNSGSGGSGARISQGNGGVCSEYSESDCGYLGQGKCTWSDSGCVVRNHKRGGGRGSGGASGRINQGNGVLNCSERQDYNCGHTVCTYTDSGCVPNTEFVGVMDEFGDEPESEDSGDFLEMDMVIEEE